MLRSAFVKPSVETSSNNEIAHLHRSLTAAEDCLKGSTKGHTENVGVNIPDDVVVVQFTDSIFFPNAHRAKRTATESIKLVYDKISNNYNINDNERSWSVASERRVEKLRKQMNIIVKESPLSIVVWDFTCVSFLDVTAVLALGELKQDIRLHCGKEVEFRIIGISKTVQERFLRANWNLISLHVDRNKEDTDVVYPSLEKAILHRNIVFEGIAIDNEKSG